MDVFMALGLNHNQFGFDSARWVRPVQRTTVKPVSPAICTLTLSFILLAVMVVESQLSRAQLLPMVDTLGLRSAVWSWTDVSGYGPIFTHALLHGSSGHFFWNVTALILVGTVVEWRLGWRMVAALFIIGAIVASFSHLLIFPTETQPLIGASGIVATLFGAAAVVAGNVGFRVRIPRTSHWLSVNARRLLLIWVGFQVFYLMTVFASPGEPLSVAYWSHLAGFAVGVVAGIIYTYRADNAAQPAAPTVFASAGD